MMFVTCRRQRPEPHFLVAPVARSIGIPNENHCAICSITKSYRYVVERECKHHKVWMETMSLPHISTTAIGHTYIWLFLPSKHDLGDFARRRDATHRDETFENFILFL